MRYITKRSLNYYYLARPPLQSHGEDQLLKPMYDFTSSCPVNSSPLISYILNHHFPEMSSLYLIMTMNTAAPMFGCTEKYHFISVSYTNA